MNRMHSSLLANLDTAVDLWEIDLPDGTTWCIGPQEAPQGSNTQGWYEPRIPSFVPWEESIGDPDNAVQVKTCSVPIVDVPGSPHSIRDMLGIGSDIQGAHVRRYLTANNVLRVNWCQLYSGILDDWALPDALSATLAIRPDDSAMTGPFLKRKATMQEWANLPDSVEGAWLGYLAGKHSDEGRNCVGSVTLWQINSVTYDYYVSKGYVNVLRVYQNVTLLTLTTHYTVRYVLVNGVRYTLVRIVTNPGSDSIRADVEAQYILGTGTGLPLMLSVAMMRTLLSDEVFGDWHDGARLPESVRIYTVSWDAVALQLVNRASGAAYCSTFNINDNSSGYDVLNKWLTGTHLYAYWRGDGTLALFFWDPNTLVTPVATLTEADCTDFQIQTSRAGVLFSSIGQWGLGGNGTRWQLEVNNPLSSSLRAETVDCSNNPNTLP
jgi:hypothetical protein